MVTAAGDKKASIAGMHRSLLREEIKKIVVVCRGPISSYKHFFTLKRRGEVVFHHKILSRPSASRPPKTDLMPSLKIRRRLRPNASKFLPEGNLYRGITMDGFLRAEHKVYIQS